MPQRFSHTIILIKMVSLYLQEEETVWRIAYKVQGFPVLYDKRVKRVIRQKKYYVVRYLWKKIGENVDPKEDSNFTKWTAEVAILCVFGYKFKTKFPRWSPIVVKF